MKEKVALVIYFVLVALSSVAFHFNYLTSTVLYFVPPSLYITVKRPDFFRPIGIYALAVGTPVVLIIDTLALYNHSWWETSVFPLRIFGLVPFDTVLWAILYVYSVLIFYEYFFDTKSAAPVLSKRFWRFEVDSILALVVFLFAFALHPKWFVIPYFYAFFVGICYILVSLIAFFRAPKGFLRLWVRCLLFSFLLLMGELAALAANQWGFSGNEYLGVIRIGSLAFPFEEMIWILTGVPPLIYIYLRVTDRITRKTRRN